MNLIAKKKTKNKKTTKKALHALRVRFTFCFLFSRPCLTSDLKKRQIQGSVDDVSDKG